MEVNPFLAHDPVFYGASVQQASLIIYALHGRSQDASFIREIAQRLDLGGTAWVIPDAPERRWYPAGFMAPTEDNEPSLSHALEMVSLHLERLTNLDRPVVLFGFSQGACLLSEYLSEQVSKVSGAILHTGGFIGPEPKDAPTRVQRNLAGHDILMLTSSQDSWVPLHRSQETEQLFRAMGAFVELKVYEEPEHHINDDSIIQIQRFLKQRFLVNS